MNDIRFKDNETNSEFILRVSAIIYDKTKTKMLLIHPIKRQVYMLPGGKVRQLEITEENFFGKEGNWATFNWISINELDNIPLHPKETKDFATGKTNHVVNIVK